MADTFQYDVFLSHSAKDKAVEAVAEVTPRFRANGLTQTSPGQARNERRPGTGNIEWESPNGA